ncbi:MAG: DnaJ domain-containing protein [Eubacteriales bacterium]
MQPYKILGLETTATKQEIKKAYFRLIRTYTPEKSPEKFKEIRAAYEYLQNDENRAQMANISTIPTEFQKAYEQVLKFMQSNEYEKGALLCEQVLHITSIEAFEILLGTCYLENNNSGKAIKVWESLCKKHPDNWVYLEYLGDAYFERGWYKKATTVYQKLLTVTSKSISLYYKLLTSLGEDTKDLQLKLAFTEQLLSYLEEKDTLSREEHEDLYALFMSFIPEESNSTTLAFILGISKPVFHISSKYCLAYTEHFNAMLHFLLLLIEIFDRYSVGESLIKQYLDFLTTCRSYLTPELASTLEVSQVFLEMKYVTKDETLHTEIVEKSDALYASHLLTNQKLAKNPLITMMIGNIEPIRVEELKCDMEWYMVNHLSEYLPSLQLIQQKYPILAMAMGQELDEMIHCTNQRTLANKYERKLRKVFKIPSNSAIFSDPEESTFDDCYDYEPYQREGTKVGRNDPCPCGSGKKYKKCCGK